MDVHKGAIYGKISRDVALAVHNGGSTDPALNLQLAAVLKRAKEQNVPRDNIERALAKAKSAGGRVGETSTYEALAHNSVGLVIECLTDNANRTIHSLRGVLTDHNARFTPVKYMFMRRGFVKIALKTCASEEEWIEKIIDTALENGAEDFERVTSSSGSTEIEFECQPNTLTKVTEALGTLSECELLESQLIYKPIESSDASNDIENKISHLVEDLEANEDTLRVWTSLDA